MPLLSQGSWGEGSETPGLAKPRDSAGILPEGRSCLPPALSCSLLNSCYFKPLAGVALTAAREVGWACTGTWPELSSTAARREEWANPGASAAGAKETQPELPTSKEMAKEEP